MKIRLSDKLKGKDVKEFFCLLMILMMVTRLEGSDLLSINELMANNQSGLADPQGQFDDWVEIYNAGNSNLDLQGYFVSDEVDDPLKWMIPGSVVVPAGGYVILWLDGDEEDGPKHLPFRLAAEGDSFLLSTPDGETVLDQVQFPEQSADISYGLVGAGFRYLINPTPGSKNNPLGVTVLEGVSFSREQGTFVESFDLEMETSTEGVEIRYTLDGSLPDGVAGASYSGPLTVAGNRCVRAGLFLDGRLISPIETKVYMELDSSLTGFDSNLPIVLIDSLGYDFSANDDPRTDYPATAVCAGFFETRVDGRADISGEAQFLGRGGMNVRGASSKTWPKKQFKFEIWDDNDEDKDVSLLGLPADSDWILAAPYFDKSLMRNDFVFHFWKQMGYYSPRTRFVEVFLNPNPGEAFSMDHYRGIYLLTEKIKRSPDRMDVSKLKADGLAEPEITGGYIAQATNLNEDWVSGEGTRYKYVEPSKADSMSAQKTWLRNYVEAAENSVYAGNFADPVNGYAKYLDVPSQVDYDIMRELSRNADGASTFFSIDRGGKLRMGPLWDYNQALGLSSLGSASLGNSWETFGWNGYYMRAGHWLAWWGRLDDDPLYQRAWNDRWVSLREGVLAQGNLLGRIDAIAALLDESQARNFDQWDILGTAVWSPNGKSRADPGELGRDTYAKEITYLRDWVEDRALWIDSQVPSPPEFNQNGGNVAVGFSLEMSEGTGYQAFPGDIYYTTDGADPADTGVLYSGPLALTTNGHIKARTKGAGGQWSALRDEPFFVGAEAPSSLNLTISEIHYNPNGSDDLEFIEVANRGTQPVNLTGVQLSSAVSFQFGEIELSSGSAIVVVEDAAAFSSAFTSPEIMVAGQWEGRLRNSGELIELRDAEGFLLHQVAYEQGGDWPEEADGDGFSLQQKDLSTDPSLASSWRLSSLENGSPGVLPVSDPLTFEEWQARHFTPAQMAQDDVSGPRADPDGDDLVNLLEFGFGLSPWAADGAVPIEIGFEAEDVEGLSRQITTLTFTRPIDSELRYLVRKSPDLLTWSSLPLIPLSSLEEAEGFERIKVRGSSIEEEVYFQIKVAR
ncbi:MAG: CotH kinase family protein [Akkermansiaceae bacterium]